MSILYLGKDSPITPREGNSHKGQTNFSKSGLTILAYWWHLWVQGEILKVAGKMVQNVSQQELPGKVGTWYKLSFVLVGGKYGMTACPSTRHVKLSSAWSQAGPCGSLMDTKAFMFPPFLVCSKRSVSLLDLPWVPKGRFKQLPIREVWAFWAWAACSLCLALEIKLFLLQTPMFQFGLTLSGAHNLGFDNMPRTSDDDSKVQLGRHMKRRPHVDRSLALFMAVFLVLRTLSGT